VALPVGQGGGSVRALKARGGWGAVNAAYRSPPRATATILHPDERVSIMDLGPGRVRGELALVEWLLRNTTGEVRKEATKLAAGYRGDRFVETEDGSCWESAFRSDADAERLAHAVITESPDTEAKQEGHAIMRAGHRVRFYEAKSKPALDSLRERMEGPPRLLIVSRDRRLLTFGELID